MVKVEYLLCNDEGKFNGCHQCSNGTAGAYTLLSHSHPSLALPDLAPRAEGNPLSTRFHWKSPMHEVMWSWLQAGETRWDFLLDVPPATGRTPSGH